MGEDQYVNGFRKKWKGFPNPAIVYYNWRSDVFLYRRKISVVSIVGKKTALIWYRLSSDACVRCWELDCIKCVLTFLSTFGNIHWVRATSALSCHCVASQPPASWLACGCHKASLAVPAMRMDTTKPGRERLYPLSYFPQSRWDVLHQSCCDSSSAGVEKRYVKLSRLSEPNFTAVIGFSDHRNNLFLSYFFGEKNVSVKKTKGGSWLGIVDWKFYTSQKTKIIWNLVCASFC